jgi:hypothetical protein
VPRLLATTLNEANIAGVLTFAEARRIAVNPRAAESYLPLR